MRSCQLGGLANLARLPTWWACQLDGVVNLAGLPTWRGCQLTGGPANLAGLPTWCGCQLGGLANLVRLPTWWACQLGNLVSATWWAGCRRATQQPAQLVIACATCHRLVPATGHTPLATALPWHTPPPHSPGTLLGHTPRGGYRAHSQTLPKHTTLFRHSCTGTLPWHTPPRTLSKGTLPRRTLPGTLPRHTPPPHWHTPPPHSPGTGGFANGLYST